MLYLALDQSTSSTKAVLLDATGAVLDRESQEHRQHYPQPGWVEHDAEEIWQNTLHVLRQLLARHPGRIADIAGLAIANQRETVVVFDRETGRPLHPAIVWQCRRGEECCAQFIQAGHEATVHRLTGLKIDPYFSASKLHWLVLNKPELRARLEAGTAVVGTIDSYLVHRLTTGRVFATDSTNASRTLLFDIVNLRWDRELCQLWLVPMQALPEVRDSSAGFGDTDLAGLLPNSIAIRGVMGDSQASLLAHGCTRPGEAKVTFGTGSSLLLNIGSTPRFSEKGVLTALAWTHAGVPTYASEGIVVSSASTLTWLRDQLGLAADVAALEQLAQEVPDNGGVYLVPAFAGLGLPYWRPAARALITGLSAHSDRRHLARAAFESIAYQLRAALEAMGAEAGLRLSSLRADGGPTASRFLMQLCADLTGVELHVSAGTDLSAVGAARAGWLGLPATAASLPVHGSQAARHNFAPSLDRTEVARLVAGWERAVGLAVEGHP